MREENANQQEKTDESGQILEFEIKVKNKFDEDRRSIVVNHLEKTKQKETSYTIGYIEDPKQAPQEKLFALTPDDSLFIELGKENDNFKHDVHIELPYVADYELFWEVGGERVDRPINRVIRDTTPRKNKRIDDARTVIVIPRDQSAWKMEIKSPRNLKEHYRPKNLLAGYLEKDNGTRDDITIGDNNEG